MKTITSTLSGLSSSLFASVGLTQLAQKLDPVSQNRCEICADAQGASLSVPCSFPAKQQN